jgi:hypothetical protein
VLLERVRHDHTAAAELLARAQHDQDVVEQLDKRVSKQEQAYQALIGRRLPARDCVTPLEVNKCSGRDRVRRVIPD